MVSKHNIIIYESNLNKHTIIHIFKIKSVKMHTIIVSYDDSVQIISFNRPKKHNAISYQVDNSIDKFQCM